MVSRCSAPCDRPGRSISFDCSVVIFVCQCKSQECANGMQRKSLPVCDFTGYAKSEIIAWRNLCPITDPDSACHGLAAYNDDEKTMHLVYYNKILYQGIHRSPNLFYKLNYLIDKIAEQFCPKYAGPGYEFSIDQDFSGTINKLILTFSIITKFVLRFSS